MTSKTLNAQLAQTIYQIYPRSFQDSNGDGVGDLRGIIQRIPYLASLDLDYIWISPFLKSPMKDFGYDVSDYNQVDPVFGTNEDLEELIATADKHNLKIMMDMVVAHTSNEHPWFQESRQSCTNPKADWFVWADAKADGSPPNNWLSVFGGSAWIWESRREQYYLTHFLKEQPALNFFNQDAENAMLDAFRYWLDRGIKGFRLDAIHFSHYDQKLRSNPPVYRGNDPDLMVAKKNPFNKQKHLYDRCRPETIDLIKKVRKLCDEYQDILLLGEISGAPALKVARDYTRRGNLHLGYTGDLIGFPEKLDPQGMSHIIENVRSYMPQGGYAWALSNHDSWRFASKIEPDKPELHPAIASCYIALLSSLPGSVCIYQGDELGLPQVDLAFEDLQDPYDKEFYPYHVGRDGSRTPFPWDRDAPSAGFSSAARTWLPIGPTHFALAAKQQDADPASALNETRKFLAFRRQTPSLTRGSFEYQATDSVLKLTRTAGREKTHGIFNLSAQNVSLKDLPAGNIQAVGGAKTTPQGELVLPPYSFGFWVEKMPAPTVKKSGPGNTF